MTRALHLKIPMKFPSLRFLRPVCVFAFATLLSVVPSTMAADASELPAAEQSGGPVVGTVPVPTGLSEDDVKGVVFKALLARRWIIQDKADGKVVARYERGKNYATLTIRYDTSEIEIAGVGSARGGGFPQRWVDNLRKDMGVFLGQVVATK